MIKVYTDEENLTEVEFLRREVSFDFRFSVPSQESFATLNEAGTVWIVTTQPKLWRTLVSSSPPKSIVMFYLGNELYSTDELSFLLDCESIFRLFQYSPIKHPKVINLISALLGSLIDSGSNMHKDFLTYLRNFRTGFHVFKRLKAIEAIHGSQTHEIPQGYSKAFADQLRKFMPELKLDSSLIDNLSQIQKKFNAQGYLYDVGFVGQTGSIRRMRIIELAQSIREITSHIVLRTGFGGNSKYADNSYFECLISSKACLIPFGVFNNYNHRYCESLIVGRLPLVGTNNLTDPNENYYWTRLYPFILRDSYRWIIRRFRSYSELELKELLQNAQSAEFAKIREFRSNVMSCALEVQERT